MKAFWLVVSIFVLISGMVLAAPDPIGIGVLNSLYCKLSECNEARIDALESANSTLNGSVSGLNSRISQVELNNSLNNATDASILNRLAGVELNNSLNNATGTSLLSSVAAMIVSASGNSTDYIAFKLSSFLNNSLSNVSNTLQNNQISNATFNITLSQNQISSASSNGTALALVVSNAKTQADSNFTLNNVTNANQYTDLLNIHSQINNNNSIFNSSITTIKTIMDGKPNMTTQGNYVVNGNITSNMSRVGYVLSNGTHQCYDYPLNLHCTYYNGSHRIDT